MGKLGRFPSFGIVSVSQYVFTFLGSSTVRGDASFDSKTHVLLGFQELRQRAICTSVLVLGREASRICNLYFVQRACQ
jgi:hypothetical protein